MIIIAILSLIINSYSVFLMRKHRHEEIHIKVSWIFLNNEIIANLGVIIAGIFVHILNSRFPDLIIGFIIAILVMKGGIKIIQEAEKLIIIK